MFRKEFRVKANSQMKASEKKKLLSVLRDYFSDAPNEELDDLISTKENVNDIKLITSSNVCVDLYVVNKDPIIFEMEGIYVPTVYALWKLPSLVHNFVIHPETLTHLMKGADLMLPGIVINGEISIKSFGTLKKGDVCSISLSNNNAPIAVGTALMSSEDMYLSGKRGRGVKVLHFYQDTLWKFGSKSKIPEISAAALTVHECRAETVGANPANVENLQSDDSIDIGSLSLSLELAETIDNPNELITMDQLFHISFMIAIKSCIKKIELPMLLSSFYKNHVIPSCPSDETLDIKKTSYKKLSKFLEQYVMSGMISVSEVSKGVFSITKIDENHGDLAAFRIPKGFHRKIDEPASEAQETFTPPNISSLYSVTSAVLPLLKLYKYNKGSTLTVAELRKVITDYVRSNELQVLDNQRYIKLDAVLASIVGSSLDMLSWEELINKCLGNMTEVFQIVYSDNQTLISKKKSPKIRVDVQMRSGNKKVTLVAGLQDFGLDLKELSKMIQKGIAASASVTKGADNNPALSIQGDQRKYLKKLLIEHLKIQSRFITGLEKVK